MKEFLLSVFILVFACALHAQAMSGEDRAVLDSLRKMLVKQQGEEQDVRIRQIVSQQNIAAQCTPVQQLRQRLKDVELASGDTKTENVNITAGHGSLNVTDNHGTINSDINVQIIKQGDTKECL